MPSRRVAVIGAGAAGLMAARELQREGHTPVVFERGAAVGGNWRYADVPASADDPLGAAGVDSSLYASLRTNLPRECMGFLDFPFVAEEGSEGDPRRYPGHEEVLRYIEAFARRFDLHGLVRLQTEVVSVRRDDASAGWKVSYCSRKLADAGGEEPAVAEEEVFDAVAVCTGTSTEPRVADIAGIDSWPGKQMHSHNYRVPDPFKGQIERVEEDGSVVFQDGSRVKADTILHCTGYNYHFPYLGEDLGIFVDDNRVGPLYKHVFPPHLAPHISFIGLSLKALVFPLLQLQSNWVAGVLSGRIELPSQEDMMEDVKTFYSELEARGCPKRHTHDLGACTYEHEDWVAKQCGHDGIEGWRKEMFIAALKNFVHHPESYRDEWEDGHLLTQANRDFTKYF